ncbi:hypothetical protein ACH5RR_001313 [Cinchona calisaya]|uniref:Uncharacterized protein n=1 Tax=Cinchona calisaya TaxID=153742 RepID=A0ABD3B308_9GENT
MRVLPRLLAVEMGPKTGGREDTWNQHDGVAAVEKMFQWLLLVVQKGKEKYLLCQVSILEKTYEVLSTNEAKRDHLRKFILLLMLEWKEFEGHLDLTLKFFQECVAELQSRETHLSLVQESVNKSSLEVNLIRKSIDQRFEEVLEKEKEFKLLQEKETKELKLLNETLSRICKEVEVREEKLNEQEKLIQLFFEKIELEQKQFEVIQNLVGERFNEIWLKEKQIEQRVHELDLKGQKLMQREKEIELREKILDLRKKEIELKEGEFDSAKISKKQSPVLDSGEKNGLQPKGKEILLPHQGWQRNQFFVAIESASYEGYNSEKFKPGTGIERNDDIGEDARSKENDGNITISDVRKGYLDIPVDDDTEPRESRELMNNGRKRGSTGTENDVIVTEQVFGVDDYHYSRTSYDLLQTLRN